MIDLPAYYRSLVNKSCVNGCYTVSERVSPHLGARPPIGSGTLGTLLLTLGWDGRHTNGVGGRSVLRRLRVLRLLTFADLAMIFMMPCCIVSK